MNLEDLKKTRSSSAPLEEVSVDAPGAASSPVDALDPSTGASSRGGKEPWGVSQDVTRSGIEIYYQAGPKRLYRIRKAPGPWTDSGPEQGSGWVDVPSMSEILDILDKPGLPWWGMKIGVEGVMEVLLERFSAGDPGWDAILFADTKDIVDVLTAKKLTVNHVRDKAGDRGQDIHDALELWAAKGIVPNPDVFAPDKKGYVEGLKQFITDSGFEPLVSEVMVASLEWEFAGRFDLGGDMPNGARVVTKSYPKRKSIVEPLPGGTWMLDLKTSKGVYPNHHLQLAGYNLASEEAYGVRYDHLGVIHVFEDGRYELVVGKANDDDFQNVRCAYTSLKRIK